MDNSQLPFLRKVKKYLPDCIIINIFTFIVMHKKREINSNFKANISFFQITVKYKNYHINLIKEIERIGAVIFCLLISYLHSINSLYNMNTQQYLKIVSKKNFFIKQDFIKNYIGEIRTELRRTLKNYLLPFLIILLLSITINKLFKKKRSLKENFQAKVPLIPSVTDEIIKPYRK
jgi:hypothetical protein